MMSLNSVKELQSLGLLTRSLQPADLAKFNDDSLKSILLDYRTSRSEELNQIVAGKDQESPALSVLLSSLSTRNKLPELLASALVYSQVTLTDELASIYSEPTQSEVAFGAAANLKRDDSINRAAISRLLEQFASLYPLIGAGAVRLLPLSLLHQPNEGIPIYFSEDGFKSDLPPHIYEFAQSQAIISCGFRDEESGFLAFPIGETAARTSVVSITFSQDNNPGMFFSLNKVRKVEVKENCFSMVQDVRLGRKLSKYKFDTWVHQSINRTILNRLKEVGKELALADRLQASYLTQSEFESNLLGLGAAEKRPAMSDASAVNFLIANAPYVNLDSAATVAELRESNPRLLTRFRESLADLGSQLQGCDADFEVQAQSLFRKEVQPIIDDMQSTLSKAVRSTVGVSLSAILPIGLALMKGPDIPMGCAAALWMSSVAGSALPNFNDYLEKRKRPAYIWSKLAR